MNSLNGGYAMIKYNSTQEELQIAYRSKKPVLCYDENRRAHWAVIEETATESVDEETQEPITIYEYSYRFIDEASSGSKLYKHEINISNLYYFVLYSSDNLPLTFNTLGMYHAGYYTLTYPYSMNLSSDLRLANSLKVISAVKIELYGYIIKKDTLDVTANQISTLNTSGNTITDTVTEV